MNKALKLKKIRTLGLIVISLVVFLGTVSVGAKSLTYETSPKKIANTTSTCKNITSLYEVSIVFDETTRGNDIVAVMKYTAEKKSGMTNAPGDKDFFAIIHYEDREERVNNFTKDGNYYVAEKVIGHNSDTSSYDVSVFIFSNDNEKCSKMSDANVSSIKDSYLANGNLSGIKTSNGTTETILGAYAGSYVKAATFMYTYDEELDFDLVYNNKYNTQECKDFQAGGKYAAYSYLLPYCVSEYVEKNISQAKLEKKYQNASARADELISAESIVTGSVLGKPAGAIERSTSNTTVKATCDAYNISDRVDNGEGAKRVANIDDPNYYTNKDVYYTSDTDEVPDTNGLCTKTCDEIITVEYGPPASTLAGFCFQYKVKVTSKFKCQTTFNGAKPVKANFKVCSVKAKCNNGTYDDQAGPSEDFDACIKDCDGGKYSESCSNKCYNKVYESSGTKKVTSDFELTPSFMDKAKDEKDTFPVLNDNSVGVNISELREATAASNYGYYYISGGMVQWQQGATFWSKLGRYYFYTSGKAQHTVNSTLGVDGAPGEKRGSRYYKYKADGDGFRRACFNTSCTTTCTQNCNWLVKYDSSGLCTINNLAANKYYSDGNSVSDSPDGDYINVHNASNATSVNNSGIYVFLNNEDADYVYDTKLKEYKDAYKKCKASASCEKTETSVFTIEVNAKTTDQPTIDKWLSFPTKGTDTIVGGKTISKAGDTTIINEDNGTCINSNSSEYKYDVEWSFAGTWEQTKTGAKTYTKPDNANGFLEYPHTFCIPANTSDVNVTWAKWKNAYETYLNEHPSATAAQAMAATQTLKTNSQAMAIDYNIRAKATDFGKYNWNINFECFYGTEPPPTTGGGDPLAYEIRAYDSDNMFPPEVDPSGVSTTAEKNVTITDYSGSVSVDVGRQPGFNWTSQAESTKKSAANMDGTNPTANEEYIIDPVSLLKEVQDEGQDVYNHEENIDYHFYLTPDSIDKIQKFFKNVKNSDLTNFTDSYTFKHGILTFSSRLFRGSYSNGLTQGTEVLKVRDLGCNNMKDC